MITLHLVGFRSFQFVLSPTEVVRGAALVTYVADFVGVGAAGIMIERGRRFPGALPPRLVRAAEERGLPVIAAPADPFRLPDMGADT